METEGFEPPTFCRSEDAKQTWFPYTKSPVFGWCPSLEIQLKFSGPHSLATHHTSTTDTLELSCLECWHNIRQLDYPKYWFNCWSLRKCPVSSSWFYDRLYMQSDRVMRNTYRVSWAEANSTIQTSTDNCFGTIEPRGIGDCASSLLWLCRLDDIHPKQWLWSSFTIITIQTVYQFRSNHWLNSTRL